MEAVLGIAVAGAFTSGSLLGGVLLRFVGESRTRRAVRAAASEGAASMAAAPESEGLSAWVLGFLQAESRSAGYSEADISDSGRSGKHADLLRYAGMDNAVSEAGLRAARLKLAIGGAAVGAVIGAAITVQLGVLAAILCAVLGAALPEWALRAEAQARSEDAERHLAEMLEVMMLGLRSGLSAERALALYPRYFDTALARSVKQAIEQWELGLVQREEALRGLARRYDSVLLGRAVESIVRSLRFGSPLADVLASTAAEARVQHRAQMEERIAKAPVKMMLPVGALMLPAMLLLVLGPVLLELVNGF